MEVINYAFDTDDVGELNHNFNPSVRRIKSVVARSQNKQVLVDLEVEGVFDGDDLSDFNEFFLNWSVAFGFEFNVPVVKPRYCGHSLSKRDGTRNTLINAGPISFSLPTPPITPSENQLANVLKMSLEVKDQNLIYLHQYAFAVSESNPISQYSFLYNLLLHMCNDRQSNVDSAILEIVPSCLQFISPNNGRQETIYTKLRNELSHKREGAKYSTTKSEIERVVTEFNIVVKNIIMTRLNNES